MKKQKRVEQKPFPLSCAWWATPVTMTRWEMFYTFLIAIIISVITRHYFGW